MKAMIFAVILLQGLLAWNTRSSNVIVGAFVPPTSPPLRPYMIRTARRRTGQITTLSARSDGVPSDPPPFRNAKQQTLDWNQVAKQAAAASQAAFKSGYRRVSVDIPQISSVDRSTTARKFEDDNNFLLTMIGLMGASKTPTKVGVDVTIKMGGFEGGGDYLSEEGLYGYQWDASFGGGVVTAIGNSEIDASSLSQLNQLDDGKSRILLFNTNLDRLSFFDKLRGVPNLDDVEPAYLLRNIGSGFVSRTYPNEYCVWKLAADGTPVLAASQPSRFEGSQATQALQQK